MAMKATVHKNGPSLNLLILARWQAPTLGFSTLNDRFGMDRIREYCQVHGVRILEPKKEGAR